MTYFPARAGLSRLHKPDPAEQAVATDMVVLNPLLEPSRRGFLFCALSARRLWVSPLRATTWLHLSRGRSQKTLKSNKGRAAQRVERANLATLVTPEILTGGAGPSSHSGLLEHFHHPAGGCLQVTF